MRVTIDRFEGPFAICEKEDRTMMNIEIAKLPPGTKEGDILFIDNESIIIDFVATDERKDKIKKLMDDLWN